MDFCGFKFDENTKITIEKLVEQNRIPHAIIIEGNDNQTCNDLAVFLSMLAVCKTDKNFRPCGKCSQCIKAKQQIHPDIYYAVPENKSQTYSIKQMREIIENSSISPNEAPLKIFVFQSAEKRLSNVVQNSLLKLLEEPPQNILFILICENSNGLLSTILSRCSIIKVSGTTKFSDKSVDLAKKIANAVVSTKEWELLSALADFTDKNIAEETLNILSIIFRDCIAYQNNVNISLDKQLAEKLSKRINIGSAVKLITISDTAINKIQQNANMILLATWLCGEYRRILWQR